MLSTLDITIVFVYIIGQLFLGYWLGRKNKNQEDYFVAGRSLPWIPVAFSVAATLISANGFVGGPGWAYSAGLQPWMMQFTIPLVIGIIMYTTMPVIYNLKLTSVYRYIELRMGVRTRLIAALGFIINSLIQISSMVFVPSLIISTLTGIGMIPVVIGVVLTSIVYTLMGGIRAVVWTDFIQMLVMWFALIFSFWFILSQPDISLSSIMAKASTAGKLKMLDFSPTIKSSTAFWGATIGGGFMWFRYFGFDQGQVQRILTSKSIENVKRSFLISAITANVLYFVIIFFGVMLFVYYDGAKFASSNQIMIDFITKALPKGVTGLALAGVFAAAMSSIDSLLNSVTTSYTKDIHERFISKKGTLPLNKTKFLALVWGIVICIFAVFGFIGTTKSVLRTVGSYISYISGPVCGIFILTMFTKKATDKGTSTASIIALFATRIISKTLKNNWIWNPFIGAVITIILGLILSAAFKDYKKDAEKYTVQGQRKIQLANKDHHMAIPLQMDKYTKATFAFFIAQFIFVFFINK